MQTSDLSEVKAQLGSFISELKLRRANPFRGGPLEALADEIKILRKGYGLSFKEIAAKLGELGVKTSAKELTEFCRKILRIEGRPSGSRPSTRP